MSDSDQDLLPIPSVWDVQEPEVDPLPSKVAEAPADQDLVMVADGQVVAACSQLLNGHEDPELFDKVMQREATRTGMLYKSQYWKFKER